MVVELTKAQEAFLSDLKTHTAISISMTQLQERYANIQSKASIKRDIETLIADGIIKRTHHKLVTRGRITSSTIYQLCEK